MVARTSTGLHAVLFLACASYCVFDVHSVGYKEFDDVGRGKRVVPQRAAFLPGYDYRRRDRCGNRYGRRLFLVSPPGPPYLRD